MSTKAEATVEDLYHVPGDRKAEIVDGEIVLIEIVKCYTSEDPDEPRVFHRGQVADAEPALPGWSMPVDDLFA